MAPRISYNHNSLRDAHDALDDGSIPMKELLPTTGYIRGGCTSIGMKKRFPTFIDSTCTAFDHIFISAGVRGLQIKIDPKDLIAFVGAVVADIEG